MITLIIKRDNTMDNKIQNFLNHINNANIQNWVLHTTHELENR